MARGAGTWTESPGKMVEVVGTGGVQRQRSVSDLRSTEIWVEKRGGSEEKYGRKYRPNDINRNPARRQLRDYGCT